MYIRSDLLQKDPQYLKGFLAHALGHFNTLDSRLIEALKRLKIRVVYFLTYAFDSLNLSVLKEDQAAPNQEKSASDLPNMNSSRGRASSQRVGGGLIAILDIILTVIAGGLGLRIMSPLWRSYFYTCEYGADGYAVSLGQGEVVARIVDDLNTPPDVPFDWMWGREGTSKYVQKRLALLRQQPVISTKLGT